MEQICFGFSGGVLPGLVTGAIIIIIGLTSIFGRGFGGMMGIWGESFGEIMGRWGESVGTFFADWVIGWGSEISAFILIIVGLVIVYSVMYGHSRR